MPSSLRKAFRCLGHGGGDGTQTDAADARDEDGCTTLQVSQSAVQMQRPSQGAYGAVKVA